MHDIGDHLFYRVSNLKVYLFLVLFCFLNEQMLGIQREVQTWIREVISKIIVLGAKMARKEDKTQFH